MPKYHVVVLCSGPVGDAALTYRLTARRPQNFTPARWRAIITRSTGISMSRERRF